MPIDVRSSLIRNSLNGTEPTWASAGAQAHAPRPLPTMEPHSASWRDGALLQRGGLGACAESEPVPEAAHLPYDPPSATEDEFRVARHSGSWGRGREWHRRGYRRGTPETRVETGPSGRGHTSPPVMRVCSTARTLGRRRVRRLHARRRSVFSWSRVTPQSSQ